MNMEFVVPSRLENLFQSSSRSYKVKDVLSKQSVTVEILQFKRAMYEDREGFIFTQFDVYCNLIRQFPEFDDSLKLTAFRVLLQVSDKMMNQLRDVLKEDVEEFEKSVSFRNRNMLMMTVYILCQFTHAFEDQIQKKTASANIGKGRRKKVSVDESECSEWPEERLKFLVVLKKLFQLPIRKFWNPPIIDYEFINYVTNSFFKLLENVEISRDKGMKVEIFRFLGAILAENRTGISYSIKILQMVQEFEHLPTVLADAVIHFMKENSADTLTSDICREATLLDIKSLVQNVNSAHSLAQFLTSIAEKCPEKVLYVVGNLLQFLEMESHVMRNCILSIIGTLLVKMFIGKDVTSKDKKLREELLGHLEDHLLDANSFVRSKVIQIFKNLVDEKVLTAMELYHIAKLLSRRIKDKASNVRKNAMSFMAQFIDVNQFVCQLPLKILKESYETEFEKLKKMKKNKPVIFDDSDDEEPTAADKSTTEGLIFDDSDDEIEAGGEKDKNDNKSPDRNVSKEDKSEEAIESAEAELDTKNEEEFTKQQEIVNYMKNTLYSAEVIHGVIEPVCALLHSSTQTDVLEAIEFFTSAAGRMVTGSEPGVKEILTLVWSNEAVVRDAALNSFKTMYLSNIQDTGDVADIAQNLMLLLRNATKDEELNLAAFVKHFTKLGEIPQSVSKILWTHFVNPDSGVTDEEKISILLLLGMISEECPGFVQTHINTLIQYGLGTEDQNNFHLAKCMLKVFCQSNQKNRGKFTSMRESDMKMHLPSDHAIVSRIKSLLVDGIKDLEDDQWTPMADEAISTLFSFMEEPTPLCAEIISKIAEVVTDAAELDNEEEETSHISNILLSRYMSLCGHIALHYLTYLKVDYFAILRRQELNREQRRRKSTVNITFSTPKYPSIRNSPKSGGKSNKRRSINKNYKLVPPIDEETTYEQILDRCAKEVKDETKLVGRLLPFVVATCASTLKEFNVEVQAAASMALSKFMLFSEKVCQENMQLFATLTEKSPAAYVRANMVVAMADLTTTYPNIVEPWTPQIYQRLSDPDVSVREASIVTLTHLILHDFVRVKSLVSEAAKCLADSEKSVADVAMYLFTELSKKGNIIFNIIPDIISSLSDPKSGFSEEKFQIVLRHMLQYVEKEKLIEGLVEKLCCRFTDSSTDIQLHELTFCLSILTLNDKCYSKLIEFKSLLKERMSDPVIMKYITNITANAKKNDAKTAAELEAFRKELGI